MLYQNSSRPHYLKEQPTCRWCPIWSKWDTSPLRKIIQDSLGRTASRKQKKHQMFGSAKKWVSFFGLLVFEVFCILGPFNIFFKVCALCQKLLYLLCFVTVFFFFCLEGHDIRGFEVDIGGVPLFIYIYTHTYTVYMLIQMTHYGPWVVFVFVFSKDSLSYWGFYTSQLPPCLPVLIVSLRGPAAAAAHLCLPSRLFTMTSIHAIWGLCRCEFLPLRVQNVGPLISGLLIEFEVLVTVGMQFFGASCSPFKYCTCTAEVVSAVPEKFVCRKVATRRVAARIASIRSYPFRGQGQGYSFWLDKEDR